jgi:Helicase conserved C-terminal domain
MDSKLHLSIKRFLAKDNRIIIDQSSPKLAINSDRIKGIIPDDLQLAMAHAILDIEAKRLRHVSDGLRPYYKGKYPLAGGLVTTTSCILSGYVGMGKTLIIILAILMRPKTNPIYIKQKIYIDNPKDITIRPQIAISYNKAINSAFIAVGPSVLAQWKETLAMTDLTYFVVDNHHSLKAFVAQLLANGAQYDVILIKNGNAKALNSNAILPITTMIADEMNRGGMAASWFVVDDYDTTNIYTGIQLPANFTLFVSSTAHMGPGFNTSDYTGSYSIRDFLRNITTKRIIDVERDPILHSMFKIEGNPAFVKANLALPSRKVYKCIYDNHDDKIIGLIRAGGLAAGYGETIEHIVEALNGDAINTAAKLMGIETNNTADMFHKLFNENYEKIDRAKSTIKLCESAIEYLTSCPISDQHGHYSLNEATNLIKRPSVAHVFSDYWQYRDNELIKHIDGILEENKAILGQCSDVIDKIKDTLGEDSCLICCLSFTGQDIVISKCCNTVICSECFKRGFRVHEDRSKFKATCANCRKSLDVIQDIIYISQKLNITQLISKGIWAEGKAPEEPVEEPEGQDRDLSHPKIAALVDIIENRAPQNLIEVDVAFDKIAAPEIDIEAPNGPKKILLFATHDETLDLIHTAMEKKSIEIIRLQGKPYEINEAIMRYKTHTDNVILLANSQRNCAGLNLQCTTDLIFFHKNSRVEVESQIVGRVCRRGQLFNVNIYFLLYHNEK